MKERIALDSLFEATKQFCIEESNINYPELRGVTDGKAVGTFVEHRLKNYLTERYDIIVGCSAKGIDLPCDIINTDIKVTSIKQPQSSCPYKSSEEKIFGLGYNLLILVYDKIDTNETSCLKYLNCTFVDKSCTADYTTTKRLNEMLKDGAIKEDIVAYFESINIPGGDIVHNEIAERIMREGVEQGFLTISNALQWRLQYKRVITLNNSEIGVSNFDIKR